MNKLFLLERNNFRKYCLTLITLLVSVSAHAQSVCTINGYVKNDSLRFKEARLEKVYLSKLDEYDRLIPIDSVSIQNGEFTFKRFLQMHEPVLLYFITGFDNGYIPVFMEPGEIDIRLNSAAYPATAKVSGTKNNDLYRKYEEISEKCVRVQIDSIDMLMAKYSSEWLDTQEGLRTRMRIGAAELLQCNAEKIRLLIDNNDSPLSPLMMEREILHLLDPHYTKLFLKSLSPSLKEHPYYRSFQNTVRSLDLKVGGELPDIDLSLRDGTTTRLSNFKGKYVLLDFWASWCAPCIKEIPFLKEINDEAKTQTTELVIISFSLDDKQKSWLDAIKSHDIDKEGWIHASDLLGMGSPAAKMFGVTAIPKTVLIDPEGKAISFSLRGKMNPNYAIHSSAFTII